MPLPQYTPNPALYHATISEVDDSSPPDAANWNPGIQALADNIANTRFKGANRGQDWRTQWAATSLVASSLMQNACWDPFTRRYLVLVVLNGVTPETRVFASPGVDDGLAAAWAPIGGAYLPSGSLPFVASAISPDPTTAGHYWQGTLTNGGTQTTDIALWNGSTWTSKFNTTASNFNTCELDYLGTRIIACFAGTTLASVISSGDGGATWPPGFTVSFSAAGFDLKSNHLPVGSGGLAIAMPRLTAQATFHYWTSPDGATWTQQHLAALDGSVQEVTGLAWGADATGACWILTVQVDSTHTATYRSPDGLGWTLQSTGPNGLAVIQDIAAVDMAVVATVGELVDGGPSTQIVSNDGGVSWYPSQGNFSTNAPAASTGFTRDRIVASDAGFLAWNTEWLRFSSLVGLPAKIN